MNKKLLFIVNAPAFFLSHRLPIALAAQEAGYEVHVATAAGEASREILDHGLVHHEVALSRSGQHPGKELATVLRLYRLMRRLRPALVHLVTIKPVLYGGLAARLARVPAVVAAVSGLGTIFMSRGGKASLVRRVVVLLYRLALGHPNLAVIFQNPDDRQTLTSLGAVRETQARMIRGSGIDLKECPWLAEPAGPPVVTMAARLLRDKGVEEFVEAARLLGQRGVPARFWLIGSCDPGNPTSVTPAELEAWQAEGVVELMGYRDDIAQQYSRSHIVCLPSYREGLPKSLVEAAACGRAVVTTDVPGCRDAIEPDISGILVPARDAAALADAIQTLAEDAEKRQAMGRAGRDLAEREFAIERIVGLHLAIYQELDKQA
ncbi:glycosyltransferase family 4 protein [Halomonas piscis]|uniref:Glycosyltransferase family 4 protein n=1 Tax=Halomonas piscis TaxID=3031727 RepID=A0ABY9YZ68_9GAMM|nr:glycosyltransferase family 4 protein [Halomonas piscis]WNK20160.1 glycosyltransferase family 4 protein [Halomonas piscis]